MPSKRSPESRPDAEHRQVLASRLRQARKTANLTLEQVAEAIGVVPESVFYWENGRNYPTADRLEKAAELYGVSLDWLMGREKRIGETPEIYYPGEAPPTDEEMRLAMDFIRAMRRRQFKASGGANGPAPPSDDG